MGTNRTSLMELRNVVPCRVDRRIRGATKRNALKSVKRVIQISSSSEEEGEREENGSEEEDNFNDKTRRRAEKLVEEICADSEKE